MAKAKHGRLFTLNNPTAPQLCPELAKEIGLNESIVLLQWEYWMRSDAEERDGHLWLRKTEREIHQFFRFWGKATIHRILQNLTTKGYMVAAAFDAGPGRSAQWFRFDWDKVATLKSIKVDCSNLEQRLLHSDPKSDQNGASVLIKVLKNKDINTPSGYKVSPKPPDPKTPYPPENFEIADWMRTHLAERFITFAEDELAALTDSWLTARKADGDRRRTLWNWQNDWLRYVCTAWAKRSSNGNGHKQAGDDYNYHSTLVAPEKPVGYFDEMYADFNQK